LPATHQEDNISLLPDTPKDVKIEKKVKPKPKSAPKIDLEKEEEEGESFVSYIYLD
jgi:hypothetical protein